MARYTFFQLDVFTDTPLQGNPLAVFPHAAGLDTKTMQALAREMNLSETTFVTDSDRATRKVRFFTPAAEIPLAGHPTIGTWRLLAERDEGLNSRIQMVKQMACGFRNREHFRTAIYFHCGGLDLYPRPALPSP